MRPLTAINEKLNVSVDKCEGRMIEGYPDLEIVNIEKFMGDIVELPETLVF